MVWLCGRWIGETRESPEPRISRSRLAGSPLELVLVGVYSWGFRSFCVILTILMMPG